MSSLCEQCGLCCDGTLFGFVAVTDEEASALRARDVAVGLRRGAPALLQRCAALEGTLCQIYEARPAVCRSFECLLLTALDEGEVDLAEAEGHVRQAHALRDALAAALPAGTTVHDARALRADGALAPEAKGQLDALEHFLLRHFRGRSGR